jgi:hypothetical protein
MSPIKPHGAWFLLAPVFLLAGIGGAVLLVVSVASGLDTNRQSVPVPGEAVVSVAQGGSQSLYFEESGTDRARVPAGFAVSFTPEGGGADIVPGPAGMTSTYHMNGRAGILHGEVTLPAGRYVVKTTLPDGSPAPNGAVLVVGGSPVAGLIGAIFGAIGIAGVSILLAVISMVVVAVKRSRSRKMQMMQQYPPMQYPPAGPPGQWPPPPGSGP